MTILEDEQEKAPPQITWITAEQAAQVHGVDPIGKAQVRNKLRAMPGGHFVRVFHEGDVIELKGKP